jgi:histidinol-phosphate/aromatic aminotransferase/cobyric acid decarboxylase-like protein
MERNILISQLKGFDLPFQFLRVTVGLAEDNKTFIENLKIIMQDIEKK